MSVFTKRIKKNTIYIFSWGRVSKYRQEWWCILLLVICCTFVTLYTFPATVRPCYKQRNTIIHETFNILACTWRHTREPKNRYCIYIWYGKATHHKHKKAFQWEWRVIGRVVPVKLVQLVFQLHMHSTITSVHTQRGCAGKLDNVKSLVASSYI